MYLRVCDFCTLWKIIHQKLIYLVGNFDSHVRQQFGRFGGAIWTSHCLSFSNANGSPGWRTNGFYEKNYVMNFRCCCCPTRTPLNLMFNGFQETWKIREKKLTIANVALLSVSNKSEAASKLACSSSRRFFFMFSRCKSAAPSAQVTHAQYWCLQEFIWFPKAIQ